MDGVGYNQHLRIQLALDTVECCQFFAGLRTSDNDPLLSQHGQIERMKRLTKFVKHVVCNISYIVDRSLANFAETPGQPWRRGSNLDPANNSRGITRTQFLVIDFDSSEVTGL